jgi:hypothetical protein
MLDIHTSQFPTDAEEGISKLTLRKSRKLAQPLTVCNCMKDPRKSIKNIGHRINTVTVEP